MSVQLVTNIRKYIGRSTDTKPLSTSTDTVPPGSTFLETDTGELFRFSDTAWTNAESDEEEAEESTSILLSAILLQLQQLNDRFALVTS